MERFLWIIKLLAYLQFLTIFLFVLAMYAARGYFHHRARKKN